MGTNASCSGGTADCVGIGTITNDDNVSVSINDISVTEGSGGGITASPAFTVSMSAASGQSVLINWATANGTATSGANCNSATSASSDYLAANGTLTLAVGATSGALPAISVCKDNVDEPDEGFVVNLTSTSAGVTFSDAQGAATITDDDTSLVTIAPSVSVTEGNAGTTNAVFTVTLSTANAQTVTVNYATSDGTATAGSDYTGVTAGVLTIAPAATSGNITVAVTGDTTPEANETFTVTLSNPTNATLGATTTSTGTITNDDNLTVSITDATVTEGDSGTTDAVFTVTLSSAALAALTVNFATANGTATAGSDYTAATGALTFAASESSKTITVAVTGDTVDEPNETFNVNLTPGTGATCTGGDCQGLGTITDDDVVTLSIADVTVTEGNSGTTNAVFTVTLSAASGQTITVDYATSNSTATAGSDYTATSGSLTFAVGDTSKTITVSVTGDTADEPSETFFMSLSNASPVASCQGAADCIATGTITDDDVPTLSVADVTVTEGNSGTTDAVFTVTLSSASTETVLVAYATSDGTATTADSDYSAASGTLTIAPAATSGTITVAVAGDAFTETNETFTLTLSSPVNASCTATGADCVAIGTITNDDTASVLTITDATVTEGNSGTTDAVFTVTLLPAIGQTVIVDYATQSVTATAVTDYTAASGSLTFTVGQTKKEITVAVVGDSVDEADETFFVNLTPQWARPAPAAIAREWGRSPTTTSRSSRLATRR